VVVVAGVEVAVVVVVAGPVPVVAVVLVAVALVSEGLSAAPGTATLSSTRLTKNPIHMPKGTAIVDRRKATRRNRSTRTYLVLEGCCRLSTPKLAKHAPTNPSVKRELMMTGVSASTVR